MNKDLPGTIPSHRSGISANSKNTLADRAISGRNINDKSIIESVTSNPRKSEDMVS